MIKSYHSVIYSRQLNHASQFTVHVPIFHLFLTVTVFFLRAVFKIGATSSNGNSKISIYLFIIISTMNLIISLYCRSYHHKILSAHFKSLPTVQDNDKISDITSSIQKCQVCIKLGHFLHKYCTNKCGAFLDAVSSWGRLLTYAICAK